ncbi:MAG: hypothetical protein H6509_10365 [Bryobacterales bacterium]|nr:hypothetical protein [Acidobacteriota bacterium]MCB9385012.1 hypothetical protein [Bryobacterales bacterium]
MSVVLVNLSVALNVNVGNNVNFGAGSSVSDAVLIVNENNCASPSASGVRFGGCGADRESVQDPQFGLLAAQNRLEWNSVHFPIPGAEVPGSPGEFYPLVKTLRITSIRSNASQLGIPTPATFPSSQITAFVSLVGPTSIAITSLSKYGGGLRVGDRRDVV